MTPTINDLSLTKYRPCLLPPASRAVPPALTCRTRAGLQQWMPRAPRYDRADLTPSSIWALVTKGCLVQGQGDTEDEEASGQQSQGGGDLLIEPHGALLPAPWQEPNETSDGNQVCSGRAALTLVSSKGSNVTSTMHCLCYVWPSTHFKHPAAPLSTSPPLTLSYSLCPRMARCPTRPRRRCNRRPQCRRRVEPRAACRCAVGGKIWLDGTLWLHRVTRGPAGTRLCYQSTSSQRSGVRDPFHPGLVIVGPPSTFLKGQDDMELGEDEAHPEEQPRRPKRQLTRVGTVLQALYSEKKVVGNQAMGCSMPDVI